MTGASSGGAGGQVDLNLGELVINEVMSQNEGAWIDENGEADDWLELVNRSDQMLDLSNYALQDSTSVRVALPARSLAPGHGKGCCSIRCSIAPKMGLPSLFFISMRTTSSTHPASITE